MFKNRDKYINDYISISRPLYFLCGPFFNEGSKSDRRRILRDFIENNGDINGVHPFPLIIDYFLAEESFITNKISIQLMEEILAKVSSKTLILLDTISTSAEYGMFTNTQTNNFTYTLTPYKEDVIKDPVGYYVKKSIEENTWISGKVKSLNYHPKIIRNAISSDIVEEYYGFTKNEVPYLISSEIVKSIRETELKHEVQFDISTHKGSDFYVYIDRSIPRPSKRYLKCSTKLLFYLVENAIDDEFGKDISKLIYELKHNKDSVVDELLKCVIDVSVHSMVAHNSLSIIEAIRSDFDLELDIPSDIKEVLIHVIEFLVLFRNGGNRYTLRKKLLPKASDIVTRFSTTYSRGLPGFANLISNDQMIQRQIMGLISKPSYEVNREAFRSFLIYSPKKNRKVITYSESDMGSLMRLAHELIVAFLEGETRSSAHSYAYKKGLSIRECVSPHVGSDFFLKLDIRKFFNNIDTTMLSKKVVSNILGDIDQSSKMIDIFERQITRMTKSCSYVNKIPIGFVPSPKLSDIYLYEFDIATYNECQRRGLVFSRYADDMLISSQNEFDIEAVKLFVSERLNVVNLELNEKKSISKSLQNIGDSIQFIGLNIVKKEFSNVLTIGNSYVDSTVLEYCEILNNGDENNRVKKVIGKLKFVIHHDSTKIRHIERVIKKKAYPDYSYGSPNDFYSLYLKNNER